MAGYLSFCGPVHFILKHGKITAPNHALAFRLNSRCLIQLAFTSIPFTISRDLSTLRLEILEQFTQMIFSSRCMLWPLLRFNSLKSSCTIMENKKALTGTLSHFCALNLSQLAQYLGSNLTEQTLSTKTGAQSDFADTAKLQSRSSSTCLKFISTGREKARWDGRLKT